MSEPQIRYCTTSDGVCIAYTDVGAGVPLVYASNVLGDVHWQAHNDDTAAEVARLITAGCRVVRYDVRGMGSSDRDIPDLSLESRLLDLSAVVAHIGLDRFALCGYTHGNPVAITYAARNPSRLTHLVLVNPYLDGESYYKTIPTAGAMIEMRALAERDWDFFTLTLASALGDHRDPERTQRTAAVFRSATTAAQYFAFAEETRKAELSPALSRIETPTLVLTDAAGTGHAALGKAVASRIRNAGYAATADYIRDLLAFLELEPVGGAPERKTTASTAIIFFTDIADSTGLTERLGDAAFRERARSLDVTLRTAVREHGGTAVDGKLLGDGLLATFSAASHAIAAALTCASAGNTLDLPLHVGLHAGDVIREDKNVYGGAVNLASRICGLSAPGEILVSDVVRGMARSSAGVEFEDRGEQQMKGVGEPVRVYAVRAAGKS